MAAMTSSRLGSRASAASAEPGRIVNAMRNRMSIATYCTIAAPLAFVHDAGKIEPFLSAETGAMRIVFSAVALALFAVAAFAADDTKPNTLTPQQIADGCLLLFDGETTFGWKIDGEAKVENGKLILGGEKESMATTSSPFSNAHVRFVYDLVGAKDAI